MGVHQNSIIWLNSQLRFFYKQFIPLLKEDDVVYCLGDVFDVRSSVNSRVATSTRKLFEDVSNACKTIYIIGGNHDYFSPESDEICNLDLLLSNIKNVVLVTHNILELGDDILIPWYDVEEEGITKISKKYEGKRIFTHTDLVTYKPKLYTYVYSGHIHIPYINGFCNNLGSVFPLTFADANTERGFYIINENELEFVPNKYCIKFWRLYSNYEEYIDKLNKLDYIEIYLPQTQIYDEKLLDLKGDFPNLSIIPIIENEIYESIEINQDIESIIENNIPENLEVSFRKIKESLKIQ